MITTFATWYDIPKKFSGTCYIEKEKSFYSFVVFDGFRVFHNDDGPAVIFSTGEENWWSYGEFHRIGGPAKTLQISGREFYYIGGKEFSNDAYWKQPEVIKFCLEKILNIDSID